MITIMVSTPDWISPQDVQNLGIVAIGMSSRCHEYNYVMFNKLTSLREYNVMYMYITPEVFKLASSPARQLASGPVGRACNVVALCLSLQFIDIDSN